MSHIFEIHQGSVYEENILSPRNDPFLLYNAGFSEIGGKGGIYTWKAFCGRGASKLHISALLLTFLAFGSAALRSEKQFWMYADLAISIDL